jgi:hypothetical protein
VSRIFCVVVVVLVVVVVVVRVVVVAAVVVVVVVVVVAAVVVVVATVVVVVAVSKSACTCVAEPALNVHVGAVEQTPTQRTKVEPALASACNWMRA